MGWTLSHIELETAHVAAMAQFYTNALGFVVTDRSVSGNMVFLSRSPAEHHQLVLSQVDKTGDDRGPLDHIAFRVAAFGDLQTLHRNLEQEPGAGAEGVSHGNAWSIYCRDPDGNRLELFVDTPWHVDQPVRFPIDLTLPEAALRQATEDAIRHLPGFAERAAWAAGFRARLGG